MLKKTAVTVSAICALGIGGIFSGASVMAQNTLVPSQQQKQQQQQQQKKVPPKTTIVPRNTGPTGAPSGAPKFNPNTTRTTTPNTAPSGTGPKVITAPTNTQRRFNNNPSANTGTSPNLVPRTFTPNRSNPQASRLRGLPAYGAGNAAIRGRNFSVWRHDYRVRRGDRWRTFVALTVLSPLLFGGYYYYPYAYISAPEDYCEGFTEDGCQLVWQSVPTIEGDMVLQCVAYCPWQ